MARKFNPNEVTFDEGVKRIREAVRRTEVDIKQVLTSKDYAVREAQKLLTVSNVPGGFTKWQLPIYLERPSQLFITVAEPNLEVPEHSHDEGDGVRFIAGGSIIYNDVELSPGDWMFIPAGVPYSFRVGDRGAIMCYCYCCCCAGIADLFSEVSNPAPMLGP